MSSASLPISTERGATQAESWAVIACSTAASLVAILWSWRRDAMLNYGDAVAHLHIARRIFDSRTPGFSQLGSVWLPLPHILLIPFVQNYEWWVTGLAGVIPSALAYIAACAGLYRLARHFIPRAAAALSLAFFALNPNLLYLQTTAMTEPLFICETIWIVVWIVEWRHALDEDPKQAARLQAAIAAMLVAAIFTRYDGWIIALIAWTGVGFAMWSRRRLDSIAFWLLSAAIAAAPILWFTYNSVIFGDWLFFARGPFSARAIELHTTAPSAWPLHPGWHSPSVALLFFLKVSLLDSVAAPDWGNFRGNVVLVVVVLGTIATWLALPPATNSASRRRAFSWILLLWLPVPFYTWSVAYGSVPVFLPAWWPHSYYNTRYGLELLPALAFGIGFAADSAPRVLSRLSISRYIPRLSHLSRFRPLVPGVAFALFFALLAYNSIQLSRCPLVYVESTKNLDARLSYDQAIPPTLRDFLAVLPRSPILMNTSLYPEIVAFTGVPLRQTINEGDLFTWRAALAAPATHAAIVLAFDGDEVDRAVKAHPAGLSVVARFIAKDQPSATVYVSRQWLKGYAPLY